jgi:hypothetical protein
VSSEARDSKNLFVEVEGKKYALNLEKSSIHDPTSKQMRS